MIKSKLKSLSFIIFTMLLIPLSLMIQPEQIVQKQYLLANAALVPSVTYESYIQSSGWQNWVSDSTISGTIGKNLRDEALKIKLVNAPSNAKTSYQVYVQNVGWQKLVSNGDIAGTTGKTLRLEAIKIVLENMPGFTVQYQVRVQNKGWMPWASDGTQAGTSGLSLRIEAIKIKIIPTTLRDKTFDFWKDASSAVPDFTYTKTGIHIKTTEDILNTIKKPSDCIPLAQKVLAQFKAINKVDFKRNLVSVQSEIYYHVQEEKDARMTHALWLHAHTKVIDMEQTELHWDTQLTNMVDKTILPNESVKYDNFILKYFN